LVVHGIAAWLLQRIDYWRLDNVRELAQKDDLPAVVVHDPVVPVAQQHEIGECGGSAVGPVFDVVRLAPGGGRGAAGVDAADIAGDDSSEYRPEWSG
jgi:hypothetical protein